VRERMKAEIRSWSRCFQDSSWVCSTHFANRLEIAPHSNHTHSERFRMFCKPGLSGHRLKDWKQVTPELGFLTTTDRLETDRWGRSAVLQAIVLSWYRWYHFSQNSSKPRNY